MGNRGGRGHRLKASWERVSGCGVVASIPRKIRANWALNQPPRRPRFPPRLITIAPQSGFDRRRSCSIHSRKCRKIATKRIRDERCRIAVRSRRDRGSIAARSHRDRRVLPRFICAVRWSSDSDKTSDAPESSTRLHRRSLDRDHAIFIW